MFLQCVLSSNTLHRSCRPVRLCCYAEVLLWTESLDLFSLVFLCCLANLYIKHRRERSHTHTHAPRHVEGQLMQGLWGLRPQRGGAGHLLLAFEQKRGEGQVVPLKLRLLMESNSSARLFMLQCLFYGTFNNKLNNNRSYWHVFTKPS